MFLIILFSPLAIWFIIFCILNRKTRHYIVHGNLITVHAGWRRHFIKINGDTVSEITKSFYLSIILKAEIENLSIEVRIVRGFFGNTVRTKINDEIIKHKNLLKEY